MRQKMEFEKKIEQLLADLANVVTIVMALVTCYMADELLIYIYINKFTCYYYNKVYFIG